MVVLPAPLGPTSAASCPARMSKLTPRSALRRVGTMAGISSAGRPLLDARSLSAAGSLVTGVCAAAWPVPIARWVAVAINSLMLVATPIDGSHYFVDILAGIGIAAFSFAAALALMTRLTLRPAAIATRYAPGPGPIPIKSYQAAGKTTIGGL